MIALILMTLVIFIISIVMFLTGIAQINLLFTIMGLVGSVASALLIIGVYIKNKQKK